MKSLATKLNEVLKMSPVELERFCHSNGIENARAYPEEWLRERAVEIVLKNR